MSPSGIKPSDIRYENDFTKLCPSSVRNTTSIPMLSRTGGIQPRGDRGIAAFGRGIVSGCCMTTLKKISKGLNFHKLRLFATAVYPFSRDGDICISGL